MNGSTVHFWQKAKWILTLVLGGLLGVFALQNVQQVELTFLLWTFESRRIVVIGISVIIGLVIGWVFGVSYRRRNPIASDHGQDGS